MKNKGNQLFVVVFTTLAVGLIFFLTPKDAIAQACTPGDTKAETYDVRCDEEFLGTTSDPLGGCIDIYQIYEMSCTQEYVCSVYGQWYEISSICGECTPDHLESIRVPCRGCSSDADCNSGGLICSYCDILSGSCHSISPPPEGCGYTSTCNNDGTCDSGEDAATCADCVGGGGSPSFSVTIAPALRTVYPDGSTAYDITITPQNGYLGTVTLSAPVCPPNSTCTFNDTTIDITNTNAQSALLTVDTTSAIVVGNYTVMVQGVDGSLNSAASANLQVNENPTAVCDNNWRNIPWSPPPSSDPYGSGYWPNFNVYSSAADNASVRFYSVFNYSGLYSLNGYVYNKCNFGFGSVCLWDTYKSFNPVNPSTNPYYDINNIYAQAVNNVYVRNNTTGTVWRWNGSAWADIGNPVPAPAWNTPHSLIDKDGRTWEFRFDTSNKPQYRCGNIACTTLTYRSATSGFSTSPTGPVQPSLSVNPNSTFYIFVDYGQITDAIIGPSVSGSYACSWDNAWIGTAGRFRCVVPASAGSYTYTTGTTNYPPPGSNICSSGPTTVGNTNGLTVVVPNPVISLNPVNFNFSGTSGGSAPPAQNLTITNTGDPGSQLNWRAQTNQNWCRVNGVNNSGSVTGGPLNKDASSTVNITVDAPSNTGTFTCTITVSDVGGVAAAKTATVIYTVRPGNPGGGNPANIIASNATCERISLSWTPGAGASSYNIYRNTINSAPAAPYASGVTATSYTDNSPTPIGTRFYYWVESVAGSLTSPNKVAANTNASGGIAANPCITISNSPSNVAVSNATCGQLTISWHDNSSNETGFRIYRDTDSNPVGATLVVTTAANATSAVYVPPNTNLYYYFVASVNSGGESVRVAAANNPVAMILCQANLLNSDKDITAVNSTAVSTNSCGTTDPLPPSISLKLGDKLKFSVNVCNTQGEAPATNIIVTDRLINLKQPATGWNARFNGNAVSPTVSGTVPNQTLVFNLSAFPVPKGAVYSLTFEAEIAVPPNFTASTGRIQNSARVNYDTGSVDFSTPLLLFNAGVSAPTIIEKR